MERIILYDYIVDKYGKEFFDKIWSAKNTIDSKIITYKCSKTLWWKCPCGKHEDFERKCSTATNYEYRCPKCSRKNRKNNRFKDLTGQKFYMLTPICVDKNKSEEAGKTYWLCKCDCGNSELKSIYYHHIVSGATRSCGCLEHPSGEQNGNWKGGLTPERQLARSNGLYSNWRKEVYEKDWYTCQCCGRSKNIEKQAHHIYSFSEYDDLRYDIDNGITMCKECHYTTESGSFHNTYGTTNNTPEQLEEYINNKRKELGINIPFTIEAYKNGNILKPIEIIGSKESA